MEAMREGSAADVPVSGASRPGFESVRDAFAHLVSSGEETGAGLSVSHQDQTVVDLCGGWADAARTRAWTHDTLVNTFSVTKAFAALAVFVLVDRGRAGLDDRVGDHWPEFATAGKADTTVRQVLAHQAGLPAFPVPRTFDDVGDWNLLTSDLAGAEPEWATGDSARRACADVRASRGGAGTPYRRGRCVDRFLREEVTGPWGLDFALGLGAGEQARAAELEYGNPAWVSEMLGEPGSLRHRALGNPSGCLDITNLNSPLWREALVPAVNGHGSSRACARLYAGLLAGGELDGVRLLDEATVAEMTRPHAEGRDLLLDWDILWGLGVQIEPTGEWGMGGIGGCDAFADPGRGYAYAYLTQTAGRSRAFERPHRRRQRVPKPMTPTEGRVRVLDWPRAYRSLRPYGGMSFGVVEGDAGGRTPSP